MYRRDQYLLVKKPHVTEKSTFATEQRNAYTFLVDRSANKIEIKNAIEKIFKVKVVKVNTQNRKGKARRVRLKWAQQPDRKFAIVELKEGDRIDVI